MSVPTLGGHFLQDVTSDHFANFATGLDLPASCGVAISPNDSTDLVAVTRGLYVGTGGTLIVTLKSEQDVTFQKLPDGALLPIPALRVLPGQLADLRLPGRHQLFRRRGHPLRHQCRADHGAARGG